jgi:glycerol uptake facilitator protein
MTAFVAEITGTALLIIFGNGVVANVVLSRSKGNGGGWIVITMGWAMAVFIAVYSVAGFSGAHLNPAVTIGLAVAGRIKDISIVPVYIAAQFIGAMLGAFIVWLTYRQHFNETKEQELQLAAFCTAPAIKSPFDNLLTEIIGTFMLMICILFIPAMSNDMGALNALPVALLVLGIGLSLGGPTGYAINPARDLGPRIMHAILPIKGKGSSDWSYSWIPVVGPVLGGMLAAWIFSLLQ